LSRKGTNTEPLATWGWSTFATLLPLTPSSTTFLLVAVRVGTASARSRTGRAEASRGLATCCAGNLAFIGEAKFLENKLLARGVEVGQRRSVNDVHRARESWIEALEEVEDEL